MDEPQHHAMITPLVNAGRTDFGDCTTFRITLRSGACYDAAAVTVHDAPEMGYVTNRSLVTIHVINAVAKGMHDVVEFMIDDVESVAVQGVPGVSPKQAKKRHFAMTNSLVDKVMAADQEELMDRYRILAAKCLDDQPEWFVKAVNRQLALFEELEHRPDDFDADAIQGLLSKDQEDHDMPAAVLLLVVHDGYRALERAYVPFMLEEDWLQKALTLLPLSFTDK